MPAIGSYIISIIVIIILNVANAPDAFMISIAIILAGWMVASAIKKE